MLEIYGILDCNVTNLSGSRTKLSVNQPASELLERGIIRQALVGVLQNLAMVTRYDSTYSVNLLLKLSFKEHYSSIRINFDGTGALALAKNRKYSPRSTPIALRSKVLEELVKIGTIIVTHKSTEHMPTDIFTRSLGIVAFRNIMTQIKECRCSTRLGLL